MDEVMFRAKPRLPDWLKKKLSPGHAAIETERILMDLGLETICQSGKCPNRNECWSQRNATFMIMGDRCTRNCSYCSVTYARPKALDPDEPAKIAEAVRRMGLKHVVITSVTRDDLGDGGVGHFSEVVNRLKEMDSKLIIEVLTPDFKKNQDSSVAELTDCPIDIFNHNIETVRRLHSFVRPQGGYDVSLQLLRKMAYARKRKRYMIKSGAMLGLGESAGELIELMGDLKKAGCQMLTLGQYLQSYAGGFKVVRYVPPDEFEHFRKIGYNVGFLLVESGPFVRSSYHAEDSFVKIKNILRPQNQKEVSQDA